MAKGYTSKDVKVLEELDHIQLNPGMYVGSTENPTHLIEECLDNALDEAQAGFATIIAVNVNTVENTCAVLDNGRGIPISNKIPITISSKLFSGAKFQDSKTAYEIASGMHGVGLVAVNALSDFYNIEIYRNKKYATYNFINGKLKKSKIVKFNEDIPFSTKIEFKPNKKIFEKVMPDLNRLRRRLITASAEMKTDTIFVLNVDNKKEVIKNTIEEQFNMVCLNGGKEKTLCDVIKLSSSNGVESFDCMFTFAEEGSVTPRTFSSVNLLPVDNGGTHLNAFHEVLRDFFAAQAKKNGYNFQVNDCLVGSRSYLLLRLKEPKFSSQTKDKLTNPKANFEIYTKQIASQLKNYFSDKQDLLESLLEKFQTYRMKIDSKKLKGNSNGKRASTKFTKLRDCSSKFGELFIAEGESAAGGLVTCRNPTKHAILPLKGKIPSAANAKDILKNKEIGELIGSLGTGVGPDFNIDNLKYSKIICATDADDDGKHIFALLTLALAILVPDVIKNGHYYLAETPLYAIREKKVFIPLWNNEELEKAKAEKKHIMRIKGLGEMTPDQLKTVLVDDTRHLTQIEYTSNIESMIKLFSEPEQKRLLLEGKWKL